MNKLEKDIADFVSWGVTSLDDLDDDAIQSLRVTLINEYTDVLSSEDMRVFAPWAVMGGGKWDHLNGRYLREFIEHKLDERLEQMIKEAQ